MGFNSYKTVLAFAVRIAGAGIVFLVVGWVFAKLSGRGTFIINTLNQSLEGTVTFNLVNPTFEKVGIVAMFVGIVLIIFAVAMIIKTLFEPTKTMFEGI